MTRFVCYVIPERYCYTSRFYLFIFFLKSNICFVLELWSVTSSQWLIALLASMSPASLWLTFRSAAIFLSALIKEPALTTSSIQKICCIEGGRSSYPHWGAGCGLISLSTCETNQSDKTGTDCTGQRALIPCLNWIKGKIVRVANEVHVNMSCFFLDLVIYLFLNGVKYLFVQVGMYILMHHLLHIFSSKISLCWIAVWKKLWGSDLL